MTLPLKSKNETQHEGEGRNISFLLPISMESKLLQLFWQAEYFSLSFFLCLHVGKVLEAGIFNTAPIVQLYKGVGLFPHCLTNPVSN